MLDRRKIRRIGCLVLLLLLLTGQAVQAEDFVLAGKGSVSINMQDGAGNPVPGGVFTLHRVGDPVLADSHLSFALSDAFKDSGVSLADLNVDSLAGQLVKYAKDHHLSGAKKTADAEGQARFGDLSVGLYLIFQDDPAAQYGYSALTAFLASVPMTNEEGTGWVYDIEAQPKVQLKPTPVPTPTPTPKPDEKLPQTGVLIWPILAMAAGGVVLFAAGWMLFFMRRKAK